MYSDICKGRIKAGRLLVSLPMMLTYLLALGMLSPQVFSKEKTSMDEQDHVVVKADFGKWVDYPLVKTKFCAYNSGYVPGYLKTYKRDINLFEELRPDSLRFDGGLGAPPGILLSDPPMVSNASGDVKYDFRQADELVDLLNSHNIDPYWCYSYVPEGLSDPGQCFSPVVKLDNWSKIVTSVAGHFKSSGRRVAYHEIYNEPDNRDFFVGTQQDYLAIYEHAVKAIRSVDPEAKVGGPSLAFTQSWIDPFLDHVQKNNLPLDFFSFHFYPGCYGGQGVGSVIDTVRYKLGRRPEMATTEMHLNEYNSLPINYPKNGPQQKHGLASALLSDFGYFASLPYLTKVHWAQFMDTGGGNWSGVISIDGRRKAAFNAWKIYARMPVDRRQVLLDGPPGVNGIASSDEHKSALVVWNRSGAAQSIKLSLHKVPFPKGTVRIYRIDSEHASWGDDPAKEDLVPVEVRKDADMCNVSWIGDVPDGGVVYIEAEDGTGKSELTPCTVAQPIQVLHYYPDRNKRSYADFDRNTWIACIGMAGEEWADAEVGVIAEKLPSKLSVKMQVDGELCQLDSNSLLGIRLDYCADGAYTKSVLFHGPYNGGVDLYSKRRWVLLPWGTKKGADEVVKVDNCAAFEIPVENHSPSNWNGRAIITCILQNAGPTVRVKVTFR